MQEKPVAKIGSHKRGRPTTRQSIKIDKKIMDYYRKGVSQQFVILETELDKNTVYDKFRHLSDTIKRANAEDFAERYEEERARHILAIDGLIFGNYKVLGYIEEKIEKHHRDGSEIPEFLFQKFSDIAKNLLNMIKEKANHTMIPSFDEHLKNKIEELMKNVLHN